MSAPKNKPMLIPVLRLMGKNVFYHNVYQNAASLAFYLLFALFPILIFISNLLGLLELDVIAMMESAQHILPEDIITLLETYLDYVSHTSSKRLLYFALVFSIWFPLRAAKCLMRSIRMAYHSGKPQKPFYYTLRQLVYTLVLLLIIGVTLLLPTFASRVMKFIHNTLSAEIIRLDSPLGLQNYLRFIPIAILMFIALGILYAVSTDQRQPTLTVMPGLLFALVCWLAVSMCFSFYVKHFANYTVIYGALGAVIMLLVWLYLTSIILILGAEFNAALSAIRKKAKHTQELSE